VPDEPKDACRHWKNSFERQYIVNAGTGLRASVAAGVESTAAAPGKRAFAGLKG